MYSTIYKAERVNSVGLAYSKAEACKSIECAQAVSRSLSTEERLALFDQLLKSTKALALENPVFTDNRAGLCDVLGSEIGFNIAAEDNLNQFKKRLDEINRTPVSKEGSEVYRCHFPFLFGLGHGFGSKAAAGTKISVSDLCPSLTGKDAARPNFDVEATFCIKAVSAYAIGVADYNSDITDFAKVISICDELGDAHIPYCYASSYNMVIEGSFKDVGYDVCDSSKARAYCELILSLVKTNDLRSKIIKVMPREDELVAAVPSADKLMSLESEICAGASDKKACHAGYLIGLVRDTGFIERICGALGDLESECVSTVLTFRVEYNLRTMFVRGNEFTDAMCSPFEVGVKNVNECARIAKDIYSYDYKKMYV